MRPTRLLPIGLATLAALAASAAPAGATSTAGRGSPPPASHACGTIPGGVALYKVRARAAHCSTARKVARTWRRKVLSDRCEKGRLRCVAAGYRCRAKPPAEVHYKVRCRRGERQRVTWWIHAD